MTFTTRPELTGTFGMVASTHWIASAVGMKLLEAGGTAADAAVGMALVLNVVEPHLNGPLGDASILVWPAEAEAPTVICGQGVAPAGATVEYYRGEGLELIPGSGLLAAVVPGVWDALMLLLRDHGRLGLRAVMEPAIGYAGAGHPVLARVAAEIAELAEVFRSEWPTSAPVWLAGGGPPVAGELFRNPDLAAFWTRLLKESEAASGREGVIERARAVFARGFVAERIDAFLRKACVIDATGERRRGVLTGEDMARWEASYEDPISMGYQGWRIWKCGAWSQGPAFLQALAMLDDPGNLLDADGVHRTVEALKLAFADRDAYLGDPIHSDIPLNILLSKEYLDNRRREIDDGAAAHEFRPGRIPGYEELAAAFVERTRRSVPDAGIGTGEPTMAHLTRGDRDTVHIDVVDRWGTAVSATPSGGWLKSNPVVPGLGVPLGTRAQMFWLDKGLPSTLAPGRRPRTTLTPTMARDPDGGRLAFGTPGGDQQEQWQLAFFLRLVHQGMNLQQAIDSPLFHTGHLQASFYPRGVNPGHLAIEPAFPEATLRELARRGHRLEVTEPWAAGRLTAVRRRADGLVSGAATPRLMQAYAVGR